MQSPGGTTAVGLGETNYLTDALVAHDGEVESGLMV